MIHTQVTTAVTVPGQSSLIYSALEWSCVRLLLQSAGPAAVGIDPNLFPIGQGKGRLLSSSVETVIVLAPSDRLYVASDAQDNIGVTVEAVPELVLLQSILTALSSQQLPGGVAPGGTPPKWPYRF